MMRGVPAVRFVLLVRVVPLLLAMLPALPFAARAADIAADARRSGFDTMSRETRAMQQDDALNPAMLWVQDGAALWKRAAGSTNRSCESCHGAAGDSMRGVAARYPAYDTQAQRPVTLA